MNQQVKSIDDVKPQDVATTGASTTDSATPNSDGLKFEETSTPSTTGVADPDAETDKPADGADHDAPVTDISEDTAAPAAPVVPSITPDPVAAPVMPTTGSSDLDGLKKDALAELRPLVDKLDLPANEKFDTLLLIIRSTDDKSLLGSAHEAAKSIEDETKRAQALLDIIKEIDYFAAQPAA
jgi:hypothetical protein